MPERVLTNGNDTLIYIRPATHAKDAGSGLLYRHGWPTGWQELIFPDEAAARSWLDNNRTPDCMD